MSTTEALSSNGISVDSMAKELTKELKAKITKHFAHEGRIVSKREYIDWGTRQRARMDAMKLLGAYPAEKHEVGGDIDLVIRDCVKEATDGQN